MSFKLTDEHGALRDALRDFLGDTITSEYRRLRGEASDESDSRVWDGLKGLGLFELFDGASGAGVVELSLIAGECGRAVLPEGLLDALVVGPFAWQKLFSTEQRERLSAAFGADFGARVMAGDLRVGSALGPGGAMTRWCERGEGVHLRVDGTSGIILAPSELDALIVEIAGRYYVIDLRSAGPNGVRTTSRRLLDTTMKAGLLEISDARAVLLGGVASLLPTVKVLKAAELSGAVGRAVEMTVEYVKTRHQFGSPIGGFQAVQHRLADMHVQAEALQALVRFAAWAADRAPQQLLLAAGAASRYGCDVSGEIVEGAIQLHGGIGFTWEYDLHFFLRRVKAIEALWRPTSADNAALIELAAR